MRKEVIFAIVAGALLGLVVAFGVWRANLALRPGATNPETQKTPQPQVNVELSIVKPEALSVLTSPKVTLTGITIPNATVGVSGELKGYVTRADAAGAFSLDIDLDGGLNEIKVVSFDKDGQDREKDILIVYSSEFAKYLNTPETASPSAKVETASDSVRQKVNQKIEMIEKSPIAYIGAITDKTDATIQIKNLQGEIEQISINKDTTDFIKTIDTTKQIESTDLAIGDFVIAMGFRDGNKILDAKRVLVTTAFKSSSRTIKAGTLTKEGIKVILKEKGNAIALKFGSSWDGPEISELTETEKYIVIGDLKDNILTVSLIKKI